MFSGKFHFLCEAILRRLLSADGGRRQSGTAVGIELRRQGNQIETPAMIGTETLRASFLDSRFTYFLNHAGDRVGVTSGSCSFF